MKAFFHPLIILLCVQNSFAQTCDTLHRLDLFYRLNSDEIGWNAEHAMDSVFKKLSLPKDMYLVKITGYSDGVGSKQSNERLSQERARRVAAYFEKYHFKASNILFKGAGSPGAIPDSSNAKLRKVHVVIFIHHPHNALFPSSLKKFEQFTLPGDLGGNIITADSTILLVPTSTFLDPEGDTVNGNITLLYREFRDTLDLLLRGIGLDIKDGFLHTTGMFELEAFSGKTPLHIVPGKKIGVIFGLNHREPLLDLYWRNDSTSNWDFKMHVTDADGRVNENRYWISGCAGMMPYCGGVDDCGRLVFLVDKGLLFANSELGISEQVKIYNDAQNNILKPIVEKISRIDKERGVVNGMITERKKEYKRRDTLIYKIERIETSGHKLVFHLRCDETEYNETMAFGGADLKIKNRVPDSLFKVEWDFCRVTAGKKNKFSMVLMKNGRKQKLQDLKMLPHDKGRVDKKAVYADYKKRLKEREKRAGEISDTIALLQKQLQLLNKKRFSLDSLRNIEAEKIRNRNLDDLNCFWQLNWPYMSEREKSLGYQKWITYFDSNRVAMRKRFESIQKQKKYRDCKKLSNQRDSIWALLDRMTQPYVTGFSDSIKTTRRDTVILSLGISKLGVYNIARPCDLPRKKSDWINIKAYLFRNDTLRITEVYLVTPPYNTMLDLNARVMYSPYQFSLSPSFHDLRIIAFDQKGTPYTNKFSLLEGSSPDKLLLQTVELVPLRNMSDIAPLFKLTQKN